MTMANAAAKKLKFDHRLVLTNWMLELFGVATFEDLGKHMRDPTFEGFNEDGISRFHQCLKLLFARPELSNDILLAYDGNIVRYWKRITSRRNADGHNLRPKYFQYLCLLFTEIYLDRYFRDPEKLLADLNAYAKRFNAGDTLQQKALGDLFAKGFPKDVQIRTYTLADLRKLAFWSATGSGKTLLMHINIMQYQHYQELHGWENDINRIILLTPNEGLSLQHLDEFKQSGFENVGLFEKDARSLFHHGGIDIIDIHKLRETSGEKTVAIDAFEGNNLVLVDEGHRGTSGAEVGHWMQMRNRLCENGFSFEYSATFGQAMKASGNKELAHEYAKCILFDYSYKYFYGDGYGKEYRILNLEDDSNEEHRRRYMTACLLAFYQQQKLFQDRQEELRRFLIEKPLWIFVGGSVTKKPRKKDVSDVVDILLFLACFVKNRDESIRYIDMLLSGSSGLHDSKGRELFAGAFTYLGQLGLSGEQTFRDILAVLFNAQVSGALHVRRLKAGGEGEVALHIGEDNEPFGLINVGDPSGLCKLCEEHPEDLAVTDSEFSDSLFRRVNSGDSTLNVLIGSKKFSEGWSSWRVSTMGLMNIGKKEGSQIIQLFGRGVRLKGLDFCLKRSHRIVGFNAPKDIERLETLNVFGIHADYMRQFKEYLEDEGLPANEDRIEFVLPVVKNLGKKPLKTIRLKEGIDFKKQGPKPTLGTPDEHLKKSRLVVDWYPKIQALASVRGQATLDTAALNEAWFTPGHLAFLDVEELYFDLQMFKSERAWYNLNLSVDRIQGLLTDNSWYVLHIPQEEMEARSFEQARRWQEIASTLLHKYCDRFYKVRKAEWEKDHLEYRTLTGDDSNFIDDYLFLIDQSRQDIVIKLEKIKGIIEKGELRNVEFKGLAAVMFGQHLYQPLVYVNSDVIEVKPVPLNEGERDFVLDLQQHCSQDKDFFKGKELYLLRNMSRGRGIGFFEAGNFYPDFILWLLVDEKQYINFIDPKGLRNLKGPDDPKIAFYKTIKSIEDDLRSQDSMVTLNSFIVSNTRLPEVGWWDGGMTKEQFEERHVFFQQEDKGTYIEKMLRMAVT
jgi:hypothetical protein